jgi:RimJ/RimL family protein N-acetyltransferase
LFIAHEPFTEESHFEWLSEMVDTGKVVQYMIVSSENNLSVGSVYIMDISYTHKKDEFGIFIGSSSLCGRGIGILATKEMLRLAFEELGLHKVYLRVFADNLPAIKCYEKAGFIKERWLKDDVFIEDSFYDMLLMSALLMPPPVWYYCKIIPLFSAAFFNRIFVPLKTVTISLY